MNKLLATLIAGVFAAASTVAIAQSTAPAATDKSVADKAKEDQKMQKSDKSKAFNEREKAAQDLSRNSPNPTDQKANVDRSEERRVGKESSDQKAQQRQEKNDETKAADENDNVE